MRKKIKNLFLRIKRFRFLKLLVSFVLLCIVAVFLLSWLKKMSFVDALYFFITTITTVGYGDYNFKDDPTSTKIVGMALMFLGLAFTSSIFSLIAYYLVSWQFEKVFGMHTYRKRNHIIVVGWNTTSEILLHELAEHVDEDILLITTESEAPKQVQKPNVDVMVADWTKEVSLKKANLIKAKALIIASQSDANNIMAILLAKKISQDIPIISIANERTNIELIKRAGARNVISPEILSGALLFTAMQETKVIDILQDVIDIRAGKTIIELELNKGVTFADIVDTYNLSIISARSVTGEDIPIQTTSHFSQGNVLLLLGDMHCVETFKAFNRKYR